MMLRVKTKETNGCGWDQYNFTLYEVSYLAYTPPQDSNGLAYITLQGKTTNLKPKIVETILEEIIENTETSDSTTKGYAREMLRKFNHQTSEKHKRQELKAKIGSTFNDWNGKISPKQLSLLKQLGLTWIPRGNNRHAKIRNEETGYQTVITGSHTHWKAKINYVSEILNLHLKKDPSKNATF